MNFFFFFLEKRLSYSEIRYGSLGIRYSNTLDIGVWIKVQQGSVLSLPVETQTEAHSEFLELLRSSFTSVPSSGYILDSAQVAFFFRLFQRTSPGLQRQPPRPLSIRPLVYTLPEYRKNKNLGFAFSTFTIFSALHQLAGVSN